MSSISDLAAAALAAGTAASASVLTAGEAKEAETTATTAPGPAVAKATSSHPDASRSTPRGALIALEGLDRSGKTTQVKLLEQRFVELGRKVKVLRFPDRTTPIGQMINGYLKRAVDMDDHVIHLLFSANRWEAAKTIQNLLASGTTVICDRYYHSGIVYSAAKRNPTLTLPWARAPEIGLPRPDLVLFLDLEEDQARARGGWGGEAYEKAEMQRRVRELFWGLGLGRVGESMDTLKAQRADGAGAAPELNRDFREEEEDIVVVDAGASVEEVAEDIWRKVEPRADAVARGEVGRTVRTVIQ